MRAAEDPRVDRVALPPQVSPPAFALSDVSPSRVLGVRTVALPVQPGPMLGPGSDALSEDLDVDLLAILEQDGAQGLPGEVTAVPVPGAVPNHDLDVVLLVGVGDGGADALRKAGAALARRTRDQEAVATSLPAVSGDEGLVAFVEGMVLGSFGFHLRSAGPKRLPVRRVVVCNVTPDDPAVLDRALALAGAGWRSRTLCTVPSNIKNPPWLAAEAEEVAEASGLAVRVWDERALERDGFGGILAVGRASATPPRLVRLEHRPARRARKAPHVVLVGKGITFDSGGLSIKPGEAMVNMKRDMTGAAVVLAVMAALRELDCPLRVTGLLCLAENAIDGDALRPGDVIRHYGGRTTEVNNTDAEGRLVLADGLAYAVDKLDPDVLVDVATLTGAVKIALGLHIGGLFCTDDVLAQRLVASGAEAGEPLWRMPLGEDYEEGLSSKVADALNAPTRAPAISAALFLQHFTAGLPWAHLDIASVGDALEDDHEWTTGPTGFGPRLLLRWLCGPDPMAGVAETGGPR
ncbi:MAG TPA: leucyl aminopeptidase family protein [Marmoricola sp.]|nr:leucyl aminopeptidase family protein [Marmoricola sp.]